MADIIVKGILFGETTEIFNIKVDNNNFLLAKRKLESEKKKIISKLREYKTAGLISSILVPKNKKIQEQLDELVRIKKITQQSILSINRFFYQKECDSPPSQVITAPLI